MSDIVLGDFLEFDVFCECAVVNRTDSSLFEIGGFKSVAWPHNETANFNQRALPRNGGQNGGHKSTADGIRS